MIEGSPGDVQSQPQRQRQLGAAALLGGCAIAWLVALSLAGRNGDPFAIVWRAAGLVTCLAGLAVAIGRARVYQGGTWRAALVAACASVFGFFSAALLLFPPVRRSLREVPGQLQGRGDMPAVVRRPRRMLELFGVLIFHGFGALTWFVSLGFSSDVGTDRQFHDALRLGAATWLVAALLIAWLWRTERAPWYWAVPFAWWLPSFLLVISVVYD